MGQKSHIKSKLPFVAWQSEIFCCAQSLVLLYSGLYANLRMINNIFKYIFRTQAGTMKFNSSLWQTLPDYPYVYNKFSNIRDAARDGLTNFYLRMVNHNFNKKGSPVPAEVVRSRCPTIRAIASLAHHYMYHAARDVAERSRAQSS